MSPECCQCLVGIIGTVINLIMLFLAIFQPRIKKYMQRPKLKLTFEERMPDLNKTIMIGNKDALSCKVLIENKGKSAAKDVQVYLNDIVLIDKNGKESQCTHILPMNLTWSFQGGNKTSVIHRFAPDMKKYCDFIFAYADSHCHLSTEDKFPVDDKQNDQIEEGEYLCHLIVLGSNCESKKYEIRFEYTGKWDEKAKDVIQIKDCHEVNEKIS